MQGCAVFLAREGSRVLAFEIQALVTSPTSGGGDGGGNFVRKQSDGGIPTGRVALLMAVLDKRLV
jgi:predicted ATP-dependent serine protease